ncbi:MAG: M81 family metallopeptidase [Rhodoferax sp.]
MKIFSASLATETNTFAPLPTGLAAFSEGGYYPAGKHPDRLTLFSGPLWAVRQRASGRGWQVVEGLVAFAQPGGTTTRHAYETLRDELLADLRAALPVDVVLLGLHGAMVADGYDDCEGDLLARVRALVGPRTVVGAELDPHNHLTPAMTTHADVLIAFKEYPHTDVLERGLELVDLCIAQAQGKVRPVAAVVDCGMIAILHTSRDPARSFVDHIQALEGRDGVLAISITHGFPWGDVPDMGTRVLVYTDNDPAGAQALARRLADELIALRDSLHPVLPGVDDALDQALALDGGPVVLSDGADNPGGGAAGDATFLLRRMLERGIRDAALGPMWDPVAVRIATDAGVGARLPLRIGGKIGPMSGEPLDLDCTVRAIQPDMQMTGLAGTATCLGDCALIETQGIEIVLISLRSQAMGTDLFTGLGCKLADKKLIVVKSSQHFYASFSKVARHVLYAGAPGTVTSDLRNLAWRKIQRPKWPIDA